MTEGIKILAALGEVKELRAEVNRLRAERRRLEHAVMTLPHVRPVNTNEWNAYLIEDVWAAIRGEDDTR